LAVSGADDPVAMLVDLVVSLVMFLCGGRVRGILTHGTATVGRVASMIRPAFGLSLAVHYSYAVEGKIHRGVARLQRGQGTAERFGNEPKEGCLADVAFNPKRPERSAVLGFWASSATS
jgi:hypothetical protein